MIDRALDNAGAFAVRATLVAFCTAALGLFMLATLVSEVKVWRAESVPA